MQLQKGTKVEALEEPEPVREFRYCKAIEIVLPHVVPPHDDFADGLPVGEGVVDGS